MAGTNLKLPDFLQQIETISGLQFCIKTFHQPVAEGTILEDVPYQFRLHTSAFCQQVKLTRNERCVQCDLRQVPQLAMQKFRPFVNRCHAGASEIIIPLIMRDHLVALGYLGQFRQSARQPKELPFYSSKRVKEALAVGVLVQRFFLYEMEHATGSQPDYHYRHTQILRFLRRNIKEDPGLKELADDLGISLSRAGHLVKEITGQTFVELKMQLRMEAAREMLLGTMLTVESIAAATGFKDARYFYRVFQKSTGESPRQWRLKNNRSELSA